MKNTSKIYQFTLVLKNVDESTFNLEDSLYEAGCDDALINFRNGAVYLDFDRKSSSLEQAVISAIRDVESASIDATVSNVAPEDWVTESEVAKRLDMKRQAVSLWIKGERRKSFPKPVMKLADKSPLWKWREITEWLYKNKLIQQELVVNAAFLENVNAALEERDVKTRKYRHGLLKKLESHAS
jgi:predicted DNA-binding transcriptional regulator AlpA